MRGGLAARMLVASAILGTLVAGVLTLFVIELVRAHEADRLSRRAEQVNSAAATVERLAVEAQTGTRGFVIAGQEEFLEPLQNARRALPREERRWRRLILDPGQRARAAALSADIRAYIDDVLLPVVATARRDREQAAQIVATGLSKRRLDAIREGFADFLARQAEISGERSRSADERAQRAVVVGIAGIAGSVLLIVLFALYLARAVAAPVRRVSQAARSVAAGDLAARVPETGAGEAAELGRTFNAMARALEESRDELEAQHAELEVQASTLEDQQEQLERANDELEAQHGELARVLAGLAEEKDRVEAFYKFGELLASQADTSEFARPVLQELCDFAGAEIGALYLADADERIRLCAVRGLAAERLPGELEPACGLAGRALEERRAVLAAHGEGGIRVSTLGEEVAVHHELHVPLIHADRVVGVATLARVADRPLDPATVETVEHLAQQAAVRVATRAAHVTARRLVTINAALLDATPLGIRLVDAEGNAVLDNAAMVRLRSEFPDVPHDANLFEQATAVAAGTTRPDEYLNFVSRIASDPDLESLEEFQSNSGRSFEVYTAPVRETETAPALGRLFIVRDVTPEREAERLKNELVATVSHELRTPLTGILGFTELLLKHDVDGESRQRYLETVHGEASRLTRLVNDFLDIQRMEAGAFSLALEPVDVRGVVAHQVELLANQTARHELVLDLPDEPVVVLGEGERLGQVVSNLVSNAIKYSPNGGTVTVAAAASDGAVRVSVADEGIGIPADQRQNVFTKFFRVDSSDTRRIGGTGLGLALCREIVEAHAGRIGFESTHGEGSTFWFELPTRNAAARPGPPRVLLIEDDENLSELLAESLRGSGFEVEMTATGEAGLESARRDPPDVICLDIGLPGRLDGWEVLTLLKASPLTAAVPVVICTGADGQSEAAALGASDFLMKPFSEELLVESVRRFLPREGGVVLVVDDDDTVRRLVVEALRDSGIGLREAADGAQALAEITARRPDVVILDLMMPNVDGFSVLEELQRDPGTRLIPVLVLTAKKLSFEERSLLQRRAVHVLEKSEFSVHELRRLVQQAVGAESPV